MNNLEISKRFRKNIWQKFIKSLNEFNLIKENDKIAICCSGGKDSWLLALCMKELKIHNKVNFDLIFLNMDPGYSKDALLNIKENANKFDIILNSFKNNIFEVVSKSQKNSYCYLCARMRRGALYGEAKKLGCNKIALAHHSNDVAETILLNMFYTGYSRTMQPIINSKHFEGMQLIRPFYFVEEEDILKWKNMNNIKVIGCGCPLEKNKKNCENSKRLYIKNLINQLKKENKQIVQNIVKSGFNINNFD